ncbi:MAG: hypothetical protein Q4E64_02875 [Phascolarctobacterium sp.]|uniref:hypothetical protein n=1 Tax=Phascolarctobacterium sp. TaxID=2049039 RepID=UPI0026DCD9FD|nr:hypothetical protein [Phascolarctobacterium sp.]MDO4920757.1 hypothetical protein [Phascolarctobacterium sp.]
MMKSRRQGIGTIFLWCLTICCSVLLIAGCGGKQITPQEYFAVLDANETKIDQILVDTSKGRGYWELGRKESKELQEQLATRIDSLRLAKDKQLADEVKSLYMNESKRLEIICAMLDSENQDGHVAKILGLYKEFEDNAKIFRDKYKIKNDFAYKEKRKEEERRQEEEREYRRQEEERKERERKAMEEHAKRIAANKREIIAYEKYSESSESFIPTNSIRIQNGELRFCRWTRNIQYPFAVIEYIVDYPNQRLRLETRGYDAGSNLIMHNRFNNQWHYFSELARNPVIKNGTLDEVAVVKEYLQSIDEWNI